MNIKLDENVHGDVREALLDQGHTVRTAMEQGLAGTLDLTGRLWIVEDYRARDWTPES